MRLELVELLGLFVLGVLAPAHPHLANFQLGESVCLREKSGDMVPVLMGDDEDIYALRARDDIAHNLGDFVGAAFYA